MYPFPGWIRHDQFLWCCMIWVIWNHWSSFGSSQLDAPLEGGHLTKSADWIFFVSGKPPWDNNVNHFSQLKSVIVCPAFLLMYTRSSLLVYYYHELTLNIKHFGIGLWKWIGTRVLILWGVSLVLPPIPPFLLFPSTSFSCLMLVVQQKTVTSQFFYLSWQKHLSIEYETGLGNSLNYWLTKQFYPGKNSCGSSCLRTSILCLKCLLDWLS